jgi:anti-sigma factor RsiW
MTPEQQLELQAYLDGEIQGRAARRVADWMATDPEARALAAEVQMTKAALAGNEPERAVPETREFYWSQIRRAIEAAKPVESTPGYGWLSAWRKYLVPVSSVAVAAVLAIGFLMSREDPSKYLAEVENLSDYVSSHSFRSRSENVFVVWLSSADQNEDELSEFPDDDEAIFQ